MKKKLASKNFYPLIEPSQFIALNWLCFLVGKLVKRYVNSINMKIIRIKIFFILIIFKFLLKVFNYLNKQLYDGI